MAARRRSDHACRRARACWRCRNGRISRSARCARRSPIRRWPKKSDDTELRDAMAAAGLSHLGQRLDEEAEWSAVLSGGEQQRVAFARALIAQARRAAARRGRHHAGGSRRRANSTACWPSACPDTIIISIGRPALLVRACTRAPSCSTARRLRRAADALAQWCRRDRAMHACIVTVCRIRSTEVLLDRSDTVIQSSQTVLPGNAMLKMNFWDAKWDLDEAQCPCDIHFNQWIERTRSPARRSIISAPARITSSA